MATSLYLSFCSLIPGKLIREWKELLFSGKPLYEGAQVESSCAHSTPEQLVEMEKLEILNNQDYDEYSVSESN